MAGSANLVDAMLVLSVGFLLFLVVSWNMQAVVFSDASPEERMQTIEAMRRAAEIQQGRELNDTPQIQPGGGEEGFAQVGIVYRDPETGKLIMVEG
jgi:hypothetical protein